MQPHLPTVSLEDLFLLATLAKACGKFSDAAPLRQFTWQISVTMRQLNILNQQKCYLHSRP